MLDPVLGQFGQLVGGNSTLDYRLVIANLLIWICSPLDFQASEILEHLDENGYQPLVLFNQKQTLIVEIHDQS
jgi:hypothetical protein